MFWSVLGVTMVIVGSLYAFPQCLRSIKRGNSKGMSVYFIVFWLLDRLLSLTYTIHLGDIPLIVKYSIGSVFVFIILYYKHID